MNLFTEHARELMGMPPEWDAYEWEAIGEPGNTKLIRVVGAIAPPKTHGADKGGPNWKARDKSTEKTAHFTPAEHEEWIREWERKTGKCSACMGRGEKFAGWSAKNGTRYKPCAVCGATGKTTNATLSGDGSKNGA